MSRKDGILKFGEKKNNVTIQFLPTLTWKESIRPPSRWVLTPGRWSYWKKLNSYKITHRLFLMVCGTIEHIERFKWQKDASELDLKVMTIEF